MTYQTAERVAVSDDGMTRPRRFYVQAPTGMGNEESGDPIPLMYDIESYGDSLAELIDNAMIHELTEDGLTVNSMGLYDYGDDIIRRGEQMLAAAFSQGGNK